MKIAMIIAQMTYFSVFVGEAESYAVPIILFAVEGIFFYLTLTYFHEKYQRLDFLEKRKIYDNYEAIKKIFDDISQGIMIVDNKNQIVYSNQAVHRLFNEPQDQEPSLSLTNLLSKVRVKSMFPHLESSVTEQILPSPENEGVS
jgi:sensor histidine kinase regulating citrate/malate metabolism